MPKDKRKNKPQAKPKLNPLDDSSRVAQPELPSLTSEAIRATRFRSVAATNKTIFRQSALRARRYMASAPVFQAPTTLQELQSRPKNVDRDIQKAQGMANLLADRPTRYSSARWVDKNGIPLAFYLSSRLCNDDGRASETAEEDGGGAKADISIASDGGDGGEEGGEDDGAGDDEDDGEDDSEDDGPDDLEDGGGMDIDEGGDGAAEDEAEAPDEDALNRSRPLSAQHLHGETFEDFYSRNPGKVIRDGLLPQTCQRMLEITQMLSSFCQPAFSFRDVRHKPQEEGPDDFSASDPRLFYHNVPTTISEQPVTAEPGSFNERRPGVEDSSETEFAERRGTTHLVHLWEAQGHPAKKYGMVPSADMTGKSSTQSQAVEWYFQASAQVASTLAGIFSVCFPFFYEKYRNAFEAGVWLTSDPGPWLGRAVVFKLQVYMHRDGLDAGPCASFPMGFFTGGEAFLPDLEAKLAYRPGDILIFMSGALYHSVSKWVSAPVPQEIEDLGISSGRVSSVFFFPEASLEALEGKPPLWGRRTMGGKICDALDFRHARAEETRRETRKTRSLKRKRER